MEENTDKPIRVSKRHYNAGRPPMFPNGNKLVGVTFDREKWKEANDWCQENLVPFQAFVRRAVDELVRRLKGKG